jgi:hypothetical protein
MHSICSQILLDQAKKRMGMAVFTIFSRRGFWSSRKRPLVPIGNHLEHEFGTAASETYGRFHIVVGLHSSPHDVPRTLEHSRLLLLAVILATFLAPVLHHCSILMSLRMSTEGEALLFGLLYSKQRTSLLRLHGQDHTLSAGHAGHVEQAIDG